VPPQVQTVRGTPFENLIVDFTEMPQVRECLSVPFQDRWKPSLLELRKPGKWQDACERRSSLGLEYLCLLDQTMGQLLWLS
jgi:hypothetical protein